MARAARDATVGRALALMHREPARGWTLATLTKEVGVSRTVLAVGYESEAALNRAFKRVFDLPPARYRRSRARP